MIRLVSEMIAEFDIHTKYGRVFYDVEYSWNDDASTVNRISRIDIYMVETLGALLLESVSRKQLEECP